MDIRKWFKSPSGSNSSSSSQVQKKDSKKPSSPIKKTSKKRRIIESDSDEDPIPIIEEKDSQLVKKSPKKNSNQRKDVAKNSPEKKKVSISDFFGSNPIVRSKKENPPPKRLKEASVHDDADFQATLQQLDTNDATKVKTNGHAKVTPPKEPKDKKVVEKTSAPANKASSGKKKSKEPLSKMEVTPKTTEKTVVKIVEDVKPATKKPKGNGGNYASYLHREGPKALGSKEIPEGEEGCLAGLTFVITGVLESIERDEAKALVEKYGGKVMTTLTKNTKYVVIGRDAGSSKLDKAEKFGTKQLDEDGLLDLIRTMPGKPGTVVKVSPKSKVKKESQAPLPNKDVACEKSQQKAQLDLEDEFEEMDFDDSFIADENLEEEVSEKKSKEDDEEKPVAESESEKPTHKDKSETSPSAESKSVKPIAESKSNKVPDTFMWVDKYKPTSLKQVIGQQGDSSNAKKLFNWLRNWRKSRSLNKKPFPGRFNANDDGAAYKAALLSGPPGVGKTTTAILVCKELGYDYFELNASDTRSKKNLQQAVSQLLRNSTLADCFKGDGGKVSDNHVIVMDEVDGMAGNEDRGGMAELIGFIKASKIPIICICNDRNHPKIRSLSNHCFDLRFQKPRVEQIKAAMMSIAFKEHIQVSPNVLQDVIVGSNQDIRQVLHNMSMWSAKSKLLNTDQTKSDIGKGTKHIKMGPFDVLREVFAIGNNPKATIMDKSDLFFHDYSIAPLFVQENYVHVIPTAAEGNKIKHLKLLSEAADSICMGDMIDKQIRTQQSWGLLPTQAIFASVIPGEVMKGNLRQMINFPAWLGKNSNRSHMDRVLQELHIHMRMRISGNKTDVALEYLPLLKSALTKPLIENEGEGVSQSLKIMEEYFLLREDFDSIIDLSLWQGQTDPRTKIQTKVKTAFTRAYNKECGKNPYAVTNVKKKKGASAEMEAEAMDVEAAESEEEDDSVEKDAMIKVKKPLKKGTSTSETSAPSTSGKKKNPPKRGGKSR